MGVCNFRLGVLALASFSFFPDLIRSLAMVTSQLLEAIANLALSSRGRAFDFHMVRHEGFTL